MKTALIALAIARALDAGTTCAALQRGAHEANPLLPSSCPVAIAVQSGMTTAQDFGLNKLAAKHPKVAAVIAWATVSVESYAAWHNTRVR